LKLAVALESPTLFSFLEILENPLIEDVRMPIDVARNTTMRPCLPVPAPTPQSPATSVPA
jgi:hypothetical protein